MSNKTLKAIAVVVAIIAIGGSYMFPKVQINQDTLQSLVSAGVQKFGSITGPDFLYPYFSVNGVRTEYRRAGLTLATTTPCVFKSPSATSTLVYAGLTVVTASSTATNWVAAKGTTPFATTTALSRFSLSSGIQGTMVASSTSLGTAVPIVDDISTFAPNTYLVWSKSGDTPAGTGFGGICSAAFVVI